MTVEGLLSAAPPVLEVTIPFGDPARYELAKDLVAIHDAGHDPAAILRLEGGRISVRRRRKKEPAPRGRIGPVYRHVPGGGLAIPTGRVLVRFPEGDSAADHEADLRRAGFRLEESLPYAPQAAWLTAENGGIVDALRRLDRLAAAPAVEHLEPQLISERRGRTPPTRGSARGP